MIQPLIYKLPFLEPISISCLLYNLLLRQTERYLGNGRRETSGTHWKVMCRYALGWNLLVSGKWSNGLLRIWFISWTRLKILGVSQNCNLCFVCLFFQQHWLFWLYILSCLYHHSSSDDLSVTLGDAKPFIFSPSRAVSLHSIHNVVHLYGLV